MLIKLISYLIVIITFYVLFCINGEFSLFYKILILELVANLIDISWFFQGNEEFDKTVIRNMIVKITGLIFVFIFVKTEDDLWKYFLIYVLSDLLGNLSLWLYIPKYIDKNTKNVCVKKHFKPVFMLLLPQVAIQIYAVLDKTMIGQLTNDMNQVAYYDQAQKVVRALLLIVSAMSTVMCSRIANSYSKGQLKNMKKYLQQSINMVWLIATPLIFGIFATVNEVVPIYFGEGYDSVIPLMCATSFILIAIGLNNVTGMQYLIQTNKQNVFTISVTIGAIVNVILNIIFIKIFGTIGAVYSSVISEFVILGIQLLYTRNIISLKNILYSSIKYIICSVVMFIIINIIGYFISPGLLSLCVKIIFGSISYFLMLILIRDKFTIDVVNQILCILKLKKVDG